MLSLAGGFPHHRVNFDPGPRVAPIRRISFLLFWPVFPLIWQGFDALAKEKWIFNLPQPIELGKDGCWKINGEENQMGPG